MDYQIDVLNAGPSTESPDGRGSMEIAVNVTIDGEMIDGTITLVPGLIDGFRKGLVAKDGDPEEWVSAPLIEHVKARSDHAALLRALVEAGREAVKAAGLH